MAIENISIENARVMFRNFAGKESRFNPAGNRNFCLVIPPELVDHLRRDGWNIKTLQPRDPDEEPLNYIQVKVNYGSISPKIYMMSGKYTTDDGSVRFSNRTLLDEDTVGSLDYAEITNIDVIVRPYQWEVNGKTGVKAYVKNMYVTIADDEFASKYMTDDEELPFN